MDHTLIRTFNRMVGKDDIVIHAGDFCWSNSPQVAKEKYISKLVGNHIFLRGSHDHWLPSSAKDCWRGTVNGQFIVACHYAMRTWERAHYGSWQVYGHSHGQLPPIGRQYDVGVDCNDFTPVSFERLRSIMEETEMTHE